MIICKFIRREWNLFDGRCTSIPLLAFNGKVEVAYRSCRACSSIKLPLRLIWWLAHNALLRRALTDHLEHPEVLRLHCIVNKGEEQFEELVDVQRNFALA